MYVTIHNVVISQINSKQGRVYFPFIFSLFIFILVRGWWVSVVQDYGTLYNCPAYVVQVFPYGSSGSAKKVIKICSNNSEFPKWAAVKSLSQKGPGPELPSKSIKRSKGSIRGARSKPLSSDVHSTFKLELSRTLAYRHYSTTLSSGDGTRKRRKSPATTPTDDSVSSQQVENRPAGCMKVREDSISDTTSPNAVDSTVRPTDGHPGAFDSLRNLEKIHGKFRKVIHIIADVNMLKYAYSLIKSKGIKDLDGKYSRN